MGCEQWAVLHHSVTYSQWHLWCLCMCRVHMWRSRVILLLSEDTFLLLYWCWSPDNEMFISSTFSPLHSLCILLLCLVNNLTPFSKQKNLLQTMTKHKNKNETLLGYQIVTTKTKYIQNVKTLNHCLSFVYDFCCSLKTIIITSFHTSMSWWPSL